MDIDFIITAIVYLLVTIFIHINISNTEDFSYSSGSSSINLNNEQLPIIKDNDKEKFVNSDTPQNNNMIDDNQSNLGLIINESELDNMDNNEQDNYMKYICDVEEADSEDTYKKLSDSLKSEEININDNDSTTDLNKYFENIKDEQYTFEPVPTTKGPNETLYQKSSLLNKENDFDTISAFDDFTQNFAPA